MFILLGENLPVVFRKRLTNLCLACLMAAAVVIYCAGDERRTDFEYAQARRARG
ncbi:hypothetical protein V3F56_14250 [Moorellaceae bacterium AZ2]